MPEIPIRCAVSVTSWEERLLPRWPSRGYLTHLSQHAFSPVADELSGLGPDANDVGSDTVKTALWLAAAPTHSPHPRRPSQNLPAGLFSVPRAENTTSQVVVRPQGCSRKEELSDPPSARANRNKPQPRPRAAIQPPLPGHRALAQSPKPREKAFNLGQGAQWKVSLLVMAEKERKKTTLLKITCLSLEGGRACQGRDTIRY